MDEIEQLRERVARLTGMVERMERGHLEFVGPEGEVYHPDWCRECRVTRAFLRGTMIDLNQLTALLAAHTDLDSREIHDLILKAVGAHLDATPGAWESMDITGVRIEIRVMGVDAEGTEVEQFRHRVDPRCSLTEVNQARPVRTTIRHVPDCACGVW